jgi:hypothetical protein
MLLLRGLKSENSDRIQNTFLLKAMMSKLIPFVLKDNYYVYIRQVLSP